MCLTGLFSGGKIMADNRIAYGLAKKYGIDTKGMSPKQVWDALKEKGVSQENAEEKYSSDGIGGVHEATEAEKLKLEKRGISQTFKKTDNETAEERRLKELGIEDDKKPRKQLKPVFIDTSGMKFENSFQEIKYKSEERQRLNARQTMEDIGVSEKEARDINKNIASYTGTGFLKIRDLSNRDFDEARSLIDKYIEKAPPYDGEIYRGLAFNDGGNFSKDLQNGNVIDMKGISSWSSNQEIAEKFINKLNNATYGVLFNCKNKKGVGIHHLSVLPNEEEVLQSSNAKFKINNVKVFTNKRGLKVYQIDCEEV